MALASCLKASEHLYGKPWEGGPTLFYIIQRVG